MSDRHNSQREKNGSNIRNGSQTAGAIDEDNGKKIAKDLAALREEMAKGTTQLLKAIDSSDANSKNAAK